MNKYTALAAGLLIGGATLSAMAAGPASGGTSQGSTRRGDLVHGIVMRWGASVHEFTKSDVRTWAKLMGPLFAKASMATLQKAANAKTFQSMENVLVGIPTPNVLGSTTSDLIFMPIVPCRILDTRPANGGTGPLAAGETRQFDVTATSSYAGQGGSATDCGGLGSGEEAPAVVVNFTTVNPVGAGYITAWPSDGFVTHPRPLAATVNYAGSDIRGNLAIVQLDLGAGNELSVYSLRATNVVGDAVGYFIRPQATPPDCVVARVDGIVNAGQSVEVLTPTCAAGYAPVSGSCALSDGIINNGTFPSPFYDGSVPTSWGCELKNPSGTDLSYGSYTECCRTPGR